MNVRRFCQCGVRLDREVADEETAYKVVMLFRNEHSGTGHQIVDGKTYAKVIQNIIKRNYERKHNPQFSQGNQLGLRSFRVIKGGR